MPNGLLCQTSWIPERFAKVGKFLKLLEDDVWDDGWQVAFVGGRRTALEANDRSQDYKRQREGSDMKRGTRGIGE
jgi:hypothetical protein